MYEKLYVILGRFAPLHNGHIKLIDTAIQTYGLEHILILIGSAQIIDENTPYSYEQRKKMIQEVFPYVYILPLYDVRKNGDILEESNLKLWLKKLKILEKKLQKEFIFLCGNENDVAYVRPYFTTLPLVDRTIDSISATKVRNALKNNDQEYIEYALTDKIRKQLL